MVDLNFTFVVQLLMFLAFLWAMNAWVLRPLLKVMDAREREVSDAKEQAEASQEQAKTLEQEYAAAQADIHRRMHQKVTDAVREKDEQCLEQRQALRRAHDLEIVELRSKALSALAEQRADFPVLSGKIAREISRRLGLGDLNA